MRTIQIAFLTLLGVVVVVAGFLTLRSSQRLWGPVVADVRTVPEGDQEIAWLARATSTDTWNRIVEAAEYLEQRWPDYENRTHVLKVDTTNAYSHLTTGVPELVISLSGHKGRLLVRWYKISDESPYESWIEKFIKRGRLPLAVIGDVTTSETLRVSKALERFRVRDDWGQERMPVLLLTTATADAYAAPLQNGKDFERQGLTDPKAPQLMDIYKGENFRFSFSNKLMAEAVLEFVREHTELWPWRPSPEGVVSSVGAANLLGSLNRLRVDVHLARPSTYDYSMYAVHWEDDKYSLDLRDRFMKLFREKFIPAIFAKHPEKALAPVSVGTDIIVPRISNPLEPRPYYMKATVNYFELTEQSPRLRQLLVLPTNADRARGYLKALLDGAAQSSNKSVDNVVVLSGDSISFNDVYRDRKIDWNVVKIPFPLVCFSHRNPVSKRAGFREHGTDDEPWADSGTQDLLFYRDMLEAVVLAAYRDDRLVTSADAFAQGMRELHWSRGFITQSKTGTPLFHNRNRHRRTGEHIICVEPSRELHHHSATITIWRRTTLNGTPRWRLIRKLDQINYN